MLINIKKSTSKKKILIMSALLIAVSLVAAYFALSSFSRSDNEGQRHSSQPQPAQNESKSSTDFADVEKQDSSGLPSAPSFCGEIKKYVDQILGSGSTSSGSESETDKKIKFRDCVYSKKGRLATVRIYEYSDDEAAQADLKKQQEQNTQIKNKSKYNVSVVVSDSNGADYLLSEQLAKGVLEEL